MLQSDPFSFGSPRGCRPNPVHDARRHGWLSRGAVCQAVGLADDFIPPPADRPVASQFLHSGRPSAGQIVFRRRLFSVKADASEDRAWFHPHLSPRRKMTWMACVSSGDRSGHHWIVLGAAAMRTSHLRRSRIIAASPAWSGDVTR